MLTTAQKMRLARLASHGVKPVRRLFGGSQTVQVQRRGVHWELDLAEGIDFSIYLLGQFELMTQRAYRRLVQPNEVVLDIGANIGAHTLPLARLVGPNGTVVAFEPTEFAMRKLLTNIDLNPELAPRIVTLQLMLASDTRERLPTAICSSWPLESREDADEFHHGRLMSTAGARLSTLDDAVSQLRLAKISFVKLDVDGHESNVLAGGIQTLRQYMPPIIMEIAPSYFKDTPQDFEHLLRILRDLGYSIASTVTGKFLPLEKAALERLIPHGCSCNVIAKPKNH